MKVEIKKETIENIEVSREDFKKYTDVQKSGITNMFDIGKVSDLSGLNRDKIKAIISNYEELENEFKQ